MGINFHNGEKSETKQWTKTTEKNTKNKSITDVRCQACQNIWKQNEIDRKRVFFYILRKKQQRLNTMGSDFLLYILVVFIFFSSLLTHCILCFSYCSENKSASRYAIQFFRILFVIIWKERKGLQFLRKNAL